MDKIGKCACGRTLHYPNKESREKVEALVAKLGEDVPVSYGNSTWMVPRHYIALHGIVGQDLARLAQKYKFREVTHG